MLRKENKRKSRGWVPFGYKYLGPGNDLFRGKPTSDTDKAAQKHDWKYHFLEQQGKRPKWSYHNADDDFIDEVHNDWGGRVAKWIFQKKRKFAELGWIHDYRTQPQSKLRDHFLKVISQPALQATMGDVDMETPKKKAKKERGTVETEIDDVYAVHRGIPDYTFASLPFQSDYIVNDSSTLARDICYRLTSPYNPQQSFITNDQNSAGGKTQYRGPLDAETILRPCNWFSYYAGMYKYYHTVSCRYTVFIENYGEPIWVYFMFANEEIPPGNADNKDMQLWKQCEYHYLNSQYLGLGSGGVNTVGFLGSAPDLSNPSENDTDQSSGSGNAADNSLYVSGNNIAAQNGRSTLMKTAEYRTGDYDREINQDANVENWTAVTTNPTLQERLIIRVKPQQNALEGNSAVNGGDNTRYRVRVQMNYLVEFKELQYALRYPVNTQPLTVNISQTQNARS
jgi:hypothetical protein